MGTLVYGGNSEHELDDRSLAHVKVAVASKLRRGESFFLNWVNPADAGSGRVSLWISPAISLEFRFHGSRSPELNRRWLQALTDTAQSTRGMMLIAESDVEGYFAELGAQRSANAQD